MSRGRPSGYFFLLFVYLLACTTRTRMIESEVSLFAPLLSHSLAAFHRSRLLSMRSFVLALGFLLLFSYASHLFVSLHVESSEPIIVTIDDTPRNTGVCECRCCLLQGAICEGKLRHHLFFNKNFTCYLCTDDFCRLNTNGTTECHWMSIIKAQCAVYEHRRGSSSSSSSFVSIRPILQ